MSPFCWKNSSPRSSRAKTWQAWQRGVWVTCIQSTCNGLTLMNRFEDEAPQSHRRQTPTARTISYGLDILCLWHNPDNHSPERILDVNVAVHRDGAQVQNWRRRAHDIKGHPSITKLRSKDPISCRKKKWRSVLNECLIACLKCLISTFCLDVAEIAMLRPDGDKKVVSFARR